MRICGGSLIDARTRSDKNSTLISRMTHRRELRLELSHVLVARRLGGVVQHLLRARRLGLTRLVMT